MCFGADYSGAYELFRSLFTDLIHMVHTPYISQDLTVGVAYG